MIGAVVCVVLAVCCAVACAGTWLVLRNDVPAQAPETAEALRALARAQHGGACHCQACAANERRWRSMRQRQAG